MDYNLKLYFKLNHVDAMIPKKGSKYAAGYDLYSIEKTLIPSNRFVKIDTGISLAIPNGYFGKIECRSSLASQGLSVLGGVIDSDYRGNLIVILLNNTNTPYEIKKHDRIAQIIFHKILQNENVIVSEDLDSTDRQYSGFGSTGV